MGLPRCSEVTEYRRTCLRTASCESFSHPGALSAICSQLTVPGCGLGWVRRAARSPTPPTADVPWVGLEPTLYGF